MRFWLDMAVGCKKNFQVRLEKQPEPLRWFFDEFSLNRIKIKQIFIMWWLRGTHSMSRWVKEIFVIDKRYRISTPTSEQEREEIFVVKNVKSNHNVSEQARSRLRNVIIEYSIFCHLCQLFSFLPWNPHKRLVLHYFLSCLYCNRNQWRKI